MVAFAAITLTGLFVAFYASDAYLNRMRTISHYENDGSAQGRLRAWNASIQMALHRPLTGVGAGQFPTTYGRYYRGEAGGPWITAHSMYFLILGELGFPGIIVLLALVIGSPFALLALRRRVLAATHGPPTTEQSEAERFLCMLAAACVGFAVAGAFLSVAYYPHLFVLTAVTAATRLSIQSRLCGSSPPSAAVRERPLARRAPSGGARSRDSNAPGVRRGI
jgi:O-antigen ligase